MDIIKNNFKSNFEKEQKPKTHTCRWCNSVFSYQSDEISKGDLTLSQREEYFNIDGLICPACNRFDNI